MSSDPSEPVIRVQGAGKCFMMYDKPYQRLLDAIGGQRRHGREFWAVRSVSFDVYAGETLGIVGRNGAGKSTLLQLISKVLEPAEGRVDVAGKVAALLELGAGFNPEFTGRENARLNAAILGLSSREIDERLDEMIEFSELGSFIEQPVKTYSSGMYVRLAFSVAIHVSPAVLIVDEALAVGDARFQAKCMSRIRKMKDAGVTILFVSHDVAAVRQLCDRAVWLDGGTVRMIGDVLTVTSRYMEYLFDAPEEATPAAVAKVEVQAGTPRPRTIRQPLVRWGSDVGSILESGLYDRAGVRRDVFYDDEPLEVRIRFRLPPNADRTETGVAFSFKDVSGLDLVVSTTLDEARPLHIPEHGDVFEYRCVLDNCLGPGDYLLVVALEDRREGIIRYFDYIEGAQYFSSAFNRVVHGRFVPKTRQSIIDAATMAREEA